MASLEYAEVLAALRSKHQPPEWALLFEVRNQTGYSSHKIRTADAIAMNLYPSKGMVVHGYEIKMSRQDLMNDLRNPDKHMEIAQHCNFWWLVVGDSSIIKEGELPERWGLMVPRGNKLVIKKQAPLREPDEFPKPFIGSLLRSALQVSPAEAEIEAEVQRRLQIEKNRWDGEHNHVVERYRRSHEVLKEAIDDFEKASGIKIQTWHGTKIGKAVDFVLKGGLRGLHNEFETILDRADKIRGLSLEGMEITTTEEEEAV